MKQIPAVEKFLADWKERAREYYRNLKEEARIEQNKEYEINEENLKFLKRLTYLDERKYSDEKIAKILAEVADENCPKIWKDRYKSEIQYQKYVAWQKKHTKIDMDMIERTDEEIEKALDREVEAKRKNLIARVEDKVGEIKDAGGLYIGVNGELNGVVIGEKGKARVETIYAGGYNVQVLHYRVLVKVIKG